MFGTLACKKQNVQTTCFLRPTVLTYTDAAHLVHQWQYDLSRCIFTAEYIILVTDIQYYNQNDSEVHPVSDP